MMMKQLSTRGADLLRDELYGLSIREYMATQIMQGLVANSEIKLDSRLAAKFAVKYTDHLIEELNESPAP
jgi:hypothetical protein